MKPFNRCKAGNDNTKQIRDDPYFDPFDKENIELFLGQFPETQAKLQFQNKVLAMPWCIRNYMAFFSRLKGGIICSVKGTIV